MKGTKGENTDIQIRNYKRETIKVVFKKIMRLLCTVLCKLMWKSWWNGENERKQRMKNPIERWAKETNRHRQKEINIKCFKYIKKMFTALNQYGLGKGSPLASIICLNSYNQYK